VLKSGKFPFPDFLTLIILSKQKREREREKSLLKANLARGQSHCLAAPYLLMNRGEKNFRFGAIFVPAQGDQMSFLKSHPKCSQTHVLSKSIHIYYCGKK
jgi:hypothetical protein